MVQPFDVIVFVYFENLFYQEYIQVYVFMYDIGQSIDIPCHIRGLFYTIIMLII